MAVNLEQEIKRLNRKNQNLTQQLEKCKEALADAVRRPMGVIPDLAEEILTQQDIDAAEARRTLLKDLTDD